MYGLSELLGSERFGPISFRVPQRPDLGDDPQLLRIRMQRFFDKLIGYVRAIEVAGVDVGDTELNNLAPRGPRVHRRGLLAARIHADQPAA